MQAVSFYIPHKVHFGVTRKETWSFLVAEIHIRLRKLTVLVWHAPSSGQTARTSRESRISSLIRHVLQKVAFFSSRISPDSEGSCS